MVYLINAALKTKKDNNIKKHTKSLRYPKPTEKVNKVVLDLRGDGERKFDCTKTKEDDTMPHF